MRLPVREFHAVLFVAALLVGCSPKPGDLVPGLSGVPNDARVSFRPWVNSLGTGEGLVLPETLRGRFIQMISESAVYVDISMATAVPIGEFSIHDMKFYWHGNGVVHGDPRRGKAWTSPMMQTLINAARPYPSDATEWKRLIERVASDPNLDSTPTEPVLRYPAR